MYSVSLGEIVLFNDAGESKPAIVVKIWESSVNLTVFEPHSSADAPLFNKFTSVIEGDEPGQWHKL